MDMDMGSVRIAALLLAVPMLVVVPPTRARADDPAEVSARDSMRGEGAPQEPKDSFAFPTTWAPFTLVGDPN